MKQHLDVRPSPIAGQWYPGNPSRLASSVDGYITAAHLPKLPGEVIAIVTPHAGHVYSGNVAGHAFAAVKGLKPRLVAVISPMHQPYSQSLLTSAHDAYQTPLGEVPIDGDAVQRLDALLKETLGAGLTPIRKDREHSLEIELPFLQRALDDPFTLLPVMVRDQGKRVTKALGHALARVLADYKALLVASTDLSHFYPQDAANRFDREFLRRLEAFDPARLLQAEEERQAFACGRGAVAAVLWAASELGADQVRILKYATSGDVSGDYHQVVGYGAAAITKSVEES
jgi:AmmeMemoRadiSam system protein B